MNSQKLIQVHHKDVNGRPNGGETIGVGLNIRWQQGKLVVNKPNEHDMGIPGDEVRLQPNGAFVETVIEAAIGRLQHYQDTEFRSQWNHDAIGKLHEALEILAARTDDRVERGVEGTHEQ